MLARYCFIMFIAINFAVGQAEDVNESIDKHIQKLQSENGRGKLSSIIALGKIGPAAKDAVPELIKHLEHRNTRIVLWSIRSLQKIGVAGIPELKKALQGPDKNMRCMILRVLEGMDPESLSTLPDMAEFLQDDDRCIQEHTLKLLTVVPEKGTHCISRLFELVTSEENEIKVLAAQVLGLLGEKTFETTRVLIKVLEKENENGNDNACAMIVTALAQASKGQLPIILEAFANHNIRLHIVRVLGLINVVKKETVAPLIASLQDGDKRLKSEAKEILQGMGAPVVPFLLQELTNERASLVISLLSILENIDAPLVDAVPILLELMKHKNVNVGYQARKVLLKIDIQYTVPKFIAMLGSSRSEEVMIGSALLQKSQGCASWLIEALSDRKTRKPAGRILLGKGEVAAVGLAKSLKHEDVEVRKVATQLLVDLESKAKSAIPFLIDYLKDEDIRPNATRVLINLREPAFDALIKSLGTDDNVLLEQIKLFLKETSYFSTYSLLKSLEDQSVREQSLELLMSLPAGDANCVIDAYAKILRHERSRFTLEKYGKFVNKILGKMGISGVKAVIRKSYQLEEHSLISILDSLDTFSAELIPDICDTIKRIRPKSQVRLLRILTKMGKEAKAALPTIDFIVKNCAWAVKIEALEVLAAIGKDAVPTLVDIFQNGDNRLRMHVAHKLHKIVPESVDEITGYNQKVYKAFHAFREVEKGIVRRYIGRSRYYSPVKSRYLEFAVAFSENNTPIFCFAINMVVGDERKIVLYDVDKKEQHVIFTEKNIAPLADSELIGPRDDADIKYLQKLQCISKLELRSPFISEKGFAYLQNFKNLTTLRIFSPCKIMKKDLVFLQKLHNLKELWLHVDITEEELTFLKDLPQLQSLYLQSSQIKDFNALTSFPGLTTLSLLKMHNGGIKHLETLRNLETLELMNMKISEDDIKELSNFKSIERLSLSMSAIGDKHLVHLNKIPKLSKLDLSRTMISDGGMKIIADLQDIITLNIAYTQVTDEGFVLLKDNIYLQNLYVSPNLSREAIKTVRDSIKTCKINIVR